MSVLQPFGPNFSKTKTLSATNTSSSVTLDATDVNSTPTNPGSGPSGGHSVMRIVASGTGAAFIRFGVGAQTAVTTDMKMLAGTVELFSKSGDTDTVAAITSGADAVTLSITCGEGW